jgi:3-deoxy-D-arabino-heptulosonate 7-phosphate (DAHP) synthase
MLPTAKAALAVGADGVMAEVHPDPSVALNAFLVLKLEQQIYLEYYVLLFHKYGCLFHTG